MDKGIFAPEHVLKNRLTKTTNQVLTLTLGEISMNFTIDTTDTNKTLNDIAKLLTIMGEASKELMAMAQEIKDQK